MVSSKVSICVPIYNNANNFKNLFYSISSNSPNYEKDINFIVYNDGSTIEGIHEEVKDFCSSKGIQYIYSKYNKGVSYAWNRLTETADSEIVILLNDDVRVHSKNWIDHIKYVFNNNSKVGIVYWCQKLIDSLSGVAKGYTKDSIRLLSRQEQYPYLRHNLCGAFFAFRKSIWNQIIQPDHSIGFWEDLVSYGEEIDFSSESHNLGYSILQLPIIFEHFRSQTFVANPEKRLRESLSRYLILKDFNEILASYPNCFGLSRKDLLLLQMSKLGIGEIFPLLKKSRIYNISRLDYSLAMLLKKWKGRKIFGFDGTEYLEKMYLTGYSSALEDALKHNELSLSKSIHFLDINQSPVFVDAKACIDHSKESLV